MALTWSRVQILSTEAGCRAAIGLHETYVEAQQYIQKQQRGLD